MLLYQFLIVFVIMAVMVGGLAYAVVDYFRSKRPKEQAATVEVIQQAAEKITAPTQELIKAVQINAGSPTSLQALIATAFGTTDYICTQVHDQSILFDHFKQLVAVADADIESIDELRAAPDDSWSPVNTAIYRIKKAGQEILMAVYRYKDKAENWTPGKDTQVEVDGWSQDGMITVGKKIDFYTRTADCDVQCQTDIHRTIKHCAKMTALNRKLFKPAAGKGMIDVLTDDANFGLIVSSVEMVLRQFQDTTLLNKSYESPVCRANGVDYVPPIDKVVGPIVDLLNIGKHIALVGQPGVGKTILSEHIISELLAKNPDTSILKLEMKDVSIASNPNGRTVLLSYIKSQVAAGKRILIWLDEAQAIMDKSDLETLLQTMDGTAIETGVISVLACLNEKLDKIPAAFMSRIHTAVELRKLTKAKAENLLEYIVQNTEASGVSRTSEFDNDQVSLRAVYQSVLPKQLSVELLDSWKPFKYNPPTKPAGTSKRS